MGEIDDDFGDLYADLEAQVSSAINGIPNFTRLCVDQEGVNEKASPSEGLKKVDSVGEDGETKKPSGSETNGEKEVAVDNGSDSEDDLNIVLNDDDCQMFPITANARSGGVVGGRDDEDEDDFVVVTDANGSGRNRKWVDQAAQLSCDGLEQSSNGHGGERGNGVKGSYHSQYSQYKYIRRHAASFPSNTKANGSAGVASVSPTLARGDWEDKGCNQLKGGYGFSLPRYMTILDVNIDTFEQKPWRHPGVDKTDFFNFGFEEESWKQYCNSLAYEAGFEREKVAQEAVGEEISQVGLGRMFSHASKIADRGLRQLEIPKGRAIQVEGSLGERRPSIDVRRPRNRDSDVVIQIAVQDSREDSSGCRKEELDHMDGTVHEAFENGDSGEDYNRDIYCCGSASGDELSIESLEGNVRKSDTSSVLKRCSQPTTASNPISMDSDNHGNDQISDLDGHHHQKVNVCTLEGNAEVIETLKNTEEGVGRNICNADPCIMETESSLGDQIQHSPSSSCYGSHSEASKDGVYIDPEKNQNPLRRPASNSVTELRESVTSDNYLSKASKINCVKTKPRDCKDSARYRGPIRMEQKRRYRRRHSVADLKVHSDDEDDAYPVFDTKDLHDRDHSTVGRSRQKERLHAFDSYDREDFSYYRETELSLGYCSERFGDSHVRTSYEKNVHRKGHWSYRDEIDPYLRRKWDERKYLVEERITRVDNEIMERDWHHCERGLTVEDVGPLNYKESRRLVSKYSSYSDKERDARWRRESDELQFRKRADIGDLLLENSCPDDFMQEEYGRFVPFSDKERDSLDEKYERRILLTGREVKNSGRRERYVDSPCLDLDNSWSMGKENEYWRHMDHRPFSSRSYRDPHTANGARWHDIKSPRNDLYDSRLSERYGRHRRQRCADSCRDSGWVGNYHDAYDNEDSIIYPNDQVHFGRRRHSWQSNLLHWTEDESISRHRADELYAEEASFSYERTSGHESRHERIHAKHGSAHGGMLIEDKQLERHRYRMIGEGSSGNCVNTSSNVIHRGKHEQTVLRCRDSVDLHLVVGEGKSSGRCQKPGSVVRNGRLETTDSKVDKKQTTFKDSNGSQTGKTGKAEISRIESNQNNEKWLNKFPVTQHDEALDLEEGQIVTEGLNEGGPIAKNHASDNAAQTGEVKKRMLHNDNAASENKVVGGYDNHRILEMLAKMEKRRERFKEPITLKKEPDKNPTPQVDPIVETSDSKQQRPARKRRWGGS